MCWDNQLDTVVSVQHCIFYVYESHVSGLYRVGCYAMACMRISLDLPMTSYLRQCLHMFHGDIDILAFYWRALAFILGRCHMSMIGYQWIRVGMMVFALVSCIYFILFDMTDGS